MCESNGSGAGSDKANQTFAEMYVFRKHKPRKKPTKIEKF